MSRDLEASRVFVRDLTQTWYHSGHAGIATDIDGTAAFLKEKIEEAGADRVVMVGNSAGAYAAILLGAMLEVDEVHAFAPYSMIGDKRYLRDHATIEKVHRAFSDQYFDLRAVLQRSERTGPIHLYYDPELTIDSWQASRLDGLPNVFHHALPGRSHELIYLLKESGDLRKIVAASLRGLSHSLDASTIPKWKEPRRPLLARIRDRILKELGRR